MPIAALILSIIGLLCMIIPYGSFITVGLCLVAVILGVLGRKNCVANNQPTGMATAGLVMGIIGLVLGGVLAVACTMCTRALNKAVEEAEKDPAFNKKAFEESLKKSMEEGMKNAAPAK